MNFPISARLRIMRFLLYGLCFAGTLMAFRLPQIRDLSREKAACSPYLPQDPLEESLPLHYKDEDRDMDTVR